MDVDMMKSSSSSGEEHMDMMTMMMQMEKLPDFCDQSFHTRNNTTTPTMQEIHFSDRAPIPTTYPSFPTSTSRRPSIPFMATPLQDLTTTSSATTTNLSLDPHNMITASKFKYPPPFSNANTLLSSIEKKNSTAAIREMIFRIAAMQPIHIDPESIKPPKRRNVTISKDPQSVAARHRRERISERIRILQRLVPGGTKMDTASMLDEAIHYVKFLKKQVQSLEQAAGANRPMVGFGFSSGMAPMPNMGYSSLVKNCQHPTTANMVGPMQMLR